MFMNFVLTTEPLFKSLLQKESYSNACIKVNSVVNGPIFPGKWVVTCYCDKQMRKKNQFLPSKLGKLSTEIAELTKSLEHTQDKSDDELKAIKTDTKNLDSAVKETEQKIEEFPDINKKNSRIGQGEITSV